jgi:hypothetical protein
MRRTVKEEVKDIASGNEILGLFDGATSYYDGRYGKLWSHPLIKGTHFNLQYNSSWDWLMPVWYKFRDLKFEGEEVSQEHALFSMAINVAIIHKCKDSPLPAFNELVSAINWYNTIKQ